MAAAGTITTIMLIGLLGVVFWSNARLRSVNSRLEAEIARADRNAREAREQARMSERHALGAQLRLASGALDASQPERAQEILRDIPLNAGREAPRSFVWRYLSRRARRNVVLLVGPTPRLTGMALSPDGKSLATTEETSGLQLWDAASGAWIRDMSAAPARLAEPVFSPGGRFVAAPPTGADAFLVWEVATGRQLARLPIDHGHFALLGAFLTGDHFLGIGAGTKSDPTGRMRLWSLSDDPSHFRVLGPWDRRLDINSASSEGQILTRDAPNLLQLRDPRTGKPTQRFEIEGPAADIAVWACARGAAFVAAVSARPRKMYVWDGRSGKLLATHGAPEHLELLSFSPDGTFVAGTDNSKAVYVINRTSGTTRLIVCEDAAGRVYPRFQFSPDSTRLAISLNLPASGTGSVSIWDPATGKRLATFPGRPEAAGKPLFTHDGRSLLIASRTRVRLWHLPGDDGNPQADRQPAGHKDEAWSLGFSPDGRTLASGSDDSEPDPTIKLWDIATARLRQAWHGRQGTVSALDFSPDGRVLASGHIVARNNVKIWEAETGRLLRTLAGHTDRVRAVRFAPDGQYLATASSDGTVRLWDRAEWRERAVLTGHGDTVHAVAFSPDGKWLASAGNEGDVRIWDLEDGNLGSVRPPRILHNRANLTALAIAPGGESLAVASTLGSITVWDTERSMPIRSIHGDGDEVRQLAYTPDGTALAAAGISGLIRLWDPATGQELISLAGHRAQINGLAFSPDGSILASCAHDGSVRFWHAQP